MFIILDFDIFVPPLGQFIQLYAIWQIMRLWLLNLGQIKYLGWSDIAKALPNLCLVIICLYIKMITSYSFADTPGCAVKKRGSAVRTCLTNDNVF
jgi:hypothetical protein